jgi:hypothetical protein
MEPWLEGIIKISDKNVFFYQWKTFAQIIKTFQLEPILK